MWNFEKGGLTLNSRSVDFHDKRKKNQSNSLVLNRFCSACWGHLIVTFFLTPPPRCPSRWKLLSSHTVSLGSKGVQQFLWSHISDHILAFKSRKRFYQRGERQTALIMLETVEDCVGQEVHGQNIYLPSGTLCTWRTIENTATASTFNCG